MAIWKSFFDYCEAALILRIYRPKAVEKTKKGRTSTMAFFARGQNILGRGQDLGILKRRFVCESGFAKDEKHVLWPFLNF